MKCNHSHQVFFHDESWTRANSTVTQVSATQQQEATAPPVPAQSVTQAIAQLLLTREGFDFHVTDDSPSHCGIE